VSYMIRAVSSSPKAAMRVAFFRMSTNGAMKSR
jgi:hypothetical protein